jgi:uncharacterized protein (TIGR02145 family)
MKPIFKTTFKVLAILGTLTLPLLSYERNDNKNSNCFTDSRDGHIYKTVTIGDQTWMAENLAYLPKVNLLSEISESKPRQYVYDYNGTSVTEAQSSDNYKKYGVLYNWSAAIKACPEGWHLPGDKEWTKLENNLISKGDSTTIENKIAKSFAALSGGHYEGNALFVGLGTDCRWWSKKQLGKIYAWVRTLKSNSSGTACTQVAAMNKIEDLKYYGISVRCVKD